VTPELEALANAILTAALALEIVVALKEKHLTHDDDRSHLRAFLAVSSQLNKTAPQVRLETYRPRNLLIFLGELET
jgi:hypothetical protein